MKTPLLLSEWIPIWTKKVLDFIPADPIATIRVGDLIAFDDPKTKDVLLGVYEKAKDALGVVDDDESWDWWVGLRPMLRWDCCSPSVVKQMMSKPGGIDCLQDVTAKEILSGLFDDPRLFDIVFNHIAPAYGEDFELTLYSRPIIQGEFFRGYPAEFRVFVQDHAVIGVSNYYPQRDLNEAFLWSAHQVAGAALELVDVCSDFTADFLCFEEPTEDAVNGWMLIECGPPHIPYPSSCVPSAHPCCFAPGKIRGIALSKQEGALDY